MSIENTINTSEEVEVTADTPTPQSASININGRPCRALELDISGDKVYIAEYLTAGEDDDATAVLMRGTTVRTDGEVSLNNTIEYNKKIVELAVKRIVLGDGREVEYSEEWYKNTPKPDMLYLKSELDDMYTDKKKA